MSIFSRPFPSKPAELLCPHCEREMSEGHDVDACARKRMSRRFFFGIMGGAAVAVAVAPQISRFADLTRQDLIGNVFLTIPQITFEMLNVIRNENKIGDTITVRRPARFIARDGMRFPPESLAETERCVWPG